MTRTRLPPPPGPAPVVVCRECGRPLDAQWQPGLSSDDGHWILTCWTLNRGDGQRCKLARFTFTDDEYATKDLSLYLEAKGFKA